MFLFKSNGMVQSGYSSPSHIMNDTLDEGQEKFMRSPLIENLGNAEEMRFCTANHSSLSERSHTFNI
jgi:hypothetical protein